MQPETHTLMDEKGVQNSTAAAIKEDSHRVQIKNVDMPDEMQVRAVELAKMALSQQLSPREIAGAIKKEFDRFYGPAWHCIVGKAFGSFVTHETHCFLFFYLDNWAIMLFKTA